MNAGLFLLLGLIAAAILAFVAPGGAMIAGRETGPVVVGVAWGLVALALAGSLIHRYRGRLGAGLRDALVWIVLAGAITTGYAYRDRLEPIGQRVLAELNPGAAVTTAPGVAEIARRRDGHFVVDTLVNGKKLTLLFDTGASSIVLRAEDAAKIGVDVSRLDFSREISTANGVSRAAEIGLDSLSVGSISQKRVRALVARPGALSESLLGMSFMEKLASWGVENNRLVLRSR